MPFTVGVPLIPACAQRQAGRQRARTEAELLVRATRLSEGLVIRGPGAPCRYDRITWIDGDG